MLAHNVVAHRQALYSALYPVAWWYGTAQTPSPPPQTPAPESVTTTLNRGSVPVTATWTVRSSLGASSHRLHRIVQQVFEQLPQPFPGIAADAAGFSPSTCNSTFTPLPFHPRLNCFLDQAVQHLRQIHSYLRAAQPDTRPAADFRWFPASASPVRRSRPRPRALSAHWCSPR